MNASFYTYQFRWAQANREGLTQMQSSLEFSLHKMKFIQILLFNTPLQAIKYGMEHFGAFYEKRYNGIILHGFFCLLIILTRIHRNQKINDCTFIR